MTDHRPHDREVPMEHVRHGENAYDRSDLGARGIIGFLIGLALTVMFIHLLIYGFVKAYARFEPKMLTRTSAIVVPERQLGPKGDPATRFPAPQLQADEVGDLNKYREAVEIQLNSAGWIDKNAGVAHIPVERAIDLVTQRGLPVRSQPAQTPEAKFGNGDGSVQGAAGGTMPRGNK
jgi:hypothetical protein